MTTINNMLMLVMIFAIMSIIIFINHEINNAHPKKVVPDWVFKVPRPNPFITAKKEKTETELLPPPSVKLPPPTTSSSSNNVITVLKTPDIEIIKSTPIPVITSLIESSKNDDSINFKNGEAEKKGSLVCDGKPVDSEIIFWKRVKGDRHYESPITPHHE